MKEFRLNGVQNSITQKTACLQNLNANHFSRWVQFSSDVRTELNAPALWSLRNRKVEDILGLKIRHLRSLHA